jgi:nucleoside-diphosphate-sugar epimerase
MGTVSLKNKRVLVTGGNGYLGSFLVKALQEKGATVFIISKNIDRAAQNYSVDITDFNALNAVIQEIQPEIVYHLAASISRNRDFSIYEEMAKINVTGTLNLLQSLQNIDAHLIFTSTSEIYGNNESPFQEHQIPNPVSPYSLSKISAELLIQTYCSNYHKKYTNLRVFNFYGPNMPEDFFIPQMINSLQRGEDFKMTKGEQTRDFLFVDDVVEALLLTAENTNSFYETLNICSGKGTKICELAAEVNNKVKSEARILIGAIPYRDNEVWEMIGDNSKIKEKIGFIPKVNLEKGIQTILAKL